MVAFFALLQIFLAAALLIPSWYLVQAIQRLWKLPQALVPLLCLLTTSLVAYGAFWTYLLSPRFGALLHIIFLVLAVVCLATFVLRGYWKDKGLISTLLIPMALMVSVSLFYNGLLLSRNEPGGMHLQAQYLLNPKLPDDSILPLLYADQIALGETRPMYETWLMSDRPPLQEGFVLLFMPKNSPLPNYEAIHNIGYQALASLLQCTWVLAMYGLLITIRASRKTVVIVMLLAIFSGFFFLNSVFTWPKLLAACLCTIGIIVALKGRKDLPSLTLGGAGYTLGFLSHSAVAFTLIPLILTLAVYYRKQLLRFAISLAVGGFPLYIPWYWYSKIYNPPGDRLLKWYFSGETSAQPTAQSFVHSLKVYYAQLGLDEFLRGRMDNIRIMLQMPVNNAGDLLRQADFRYIFWSMGVLNIGFLVMGWHYVVRRRVTAIKFADVLLVGVPLMSLLLWCLSLFGGGQATIIHQGSYLNQLLLYVGLGGAIAKLPGYYGYVLTGIAFLWFMYVWGGRAIQEVVSPPALMLASVALTCILLILTKYSNIQQASDV